MQFLAILTALGLSSLAAGLAIRDTPITVANPKVVVTCQDQTFAWAGGVAPYEVTVLPPSGSAITVGSTDNTYIEWEVSGVTPYTEITIQVEDSDGETGTASSVLVVLGFTTEC